MPVLVPLPLAHAYGLLVFCIGFHRDEGARTILMRWFDPARSCPREITIVPTVPLTSVGKLDRKKLRQWVRGEAQA